jgi:hypothetical protein
MVLFLREASVRALEAQHPHRPLFGLLLGWTAKAFGTRPGPYVAIATAFWGLLAWQTTRLYRHLAPGSSHAAPLAGLLTLAPALVSTQYTTVTTVLPANLPVSMVLAALLLVLTESERPGGARLVVAAILVSGSVLLSEYGIAAAAAAVALLWVCRRRRAAVACLLGAAVGYAVFRATADLSVRVKQSPSAQLGNLLGHPHVAVLRFFEGLWTCLAGAWGTAAGAIRFSVSDRSTLLAALVGLGAAAVFLLPAPSGREARTSSFEDRAGVGLLAAVAAGILPVVLANRSLMSSDPYESRYLLPVLPFAASAVVWSLVRVSSERGRRFVLAAVAFVAAYRVVAGAFETRQEQQRMEEIGAQLRPLVRDSAGITVAVVPDKWKLDGSDMTPKVTWKWSDAEARRVWVMPAGRGAEEFGHRGGCRGTEKIALAPELMSTPRVGALSHLVWLSAWGRTLGELEPYCLGPVR